MATRIENDLQLSNEEAVDHKTFLAILFSLNWLSFGYALAFSSNTQFIYIKQHIMTKNQAGFYGSVLAIGALLGSLTSGLFLKRYMSHKYCVVLSCMVSALGWYLHVIFLAYDQNNVTGAQVILIFARIIVGFACGVSAYSVPVSVTSSVPVKYRHLVGVLPPLAMNMGYLICYLSGWLLMRSDVSSSLMTQSRSVPIGNVLFFNKSMSFSPIIGMVLNIIGLCCTLIFPDDSEETVGDIVGQSIYDPLLYSTSFIQSYREITATLSQPYIKKELLLGVGIMFFQQMMGINVIIFNATSIFSWFLSNSTNSPSTPSLVCVFIGLVYFISTFATICLSKFFKRKTIFYISTIVLCIFHFMFAVIYYKNYISSAFGPILAIFFILVFCCSWGPFPWLIISEIYAPDIKILGITLSTCVTWISMFLVTVTYAPLCSVIGHVGFSCILFCLAIVALLFVHFFLPETKNKTLQEIQDNFRR